LFPLIGYGNQPDKCTLLRNLRFDNNGLLGARTLQRPFAGHFSTARRTARIAPINSCSVLFVIRPRRCECRARLLRTERPALPDKPDCHALPHGAHHRAVSRTGHIIRSSSATRLSGLSPDSARLMLATARCNPSAPAAAIAAAELCGEPITLGNDRNG